MAGGHVLHFGPRKAMGLRFAGPSKGVRNGVFRAVRNVVEAAADLTPGARRNNSLSSSGRFLVLGSLAVVVVAISLGFAFNGAWLVLPFAGLGLLVAAMEFRYLERHAGDYDCMTVRDDQVVIKLWDRESVSRFELNRYWAQAVFSGSHWAWKAAG